MKEFKMKPIETNNPNPKMTKDEIYWMSEGSRTASFLLVIPGTTIFGAGFGLVIGNLIAGSLMGFGMGCLIWGLVVALRKRMHYSSPSL